MTGAVSTYSNQQSGVLNFRQAPELEGDVPTCARPKPFIWSQRRKRPGERDRERRRGRPPPRRSSRRRPPPGPPPRDPSSQSWRRPRSLSQSRSPRSRGPSCMSPGAGERSRRSRGGPSGVRCISRVREPTDSRSASGRTLGGGRRRPLAPRPPRCLSLMTDSSSKSRRPRRGPPLPGPPPPPPRRPIMSSCRRISSSAISMMMRSAASMLPGSVPVKISCIAPSMSPCCGARPSARSSGLTEARTPVSCTRWMLLPFFPINRFAALNSGRNGKFTTTLRTRLPPLELLGTSCTEMPGG
mmetsp:Transcript_25784/g.73033  ORF Transcript_25784/g.73033 Transcript_25784/m.73033 type:complete len:299 (+) Transcript_25784:321-1217(+)